ncbi:MAG TPA: hypothetical protein VHO06_19080 [Polyangia bacterium]|nr:hypothetical protein [Polyangia bacterium]
MAQIVPIGLSLGLVVLWVAGLSLQASAWLTWLELLAGVVAFGGSARFGETPRARAAGWGALAAALAVVWIVALAVRATGWLTWWTLPFAAAFAMLSLASTVGRRLHPKSA